MVAVFSKCLFNSHLSSLNLNEIEEAGIPNSQDSPNSTQSLDLQKKKLSKSQQIVFSGNSTNFVEQESNPPESDWVISITEKPEQAHQDDAANLRTESCIYKVPRCLRKVNNEAYLPRIVSLGPYHHDRKHLKEMEPHKQQIRRQFLKRRNHDVKIYQDSIKELEEKARACYEGTITLGSDEFVEMMVLDGCFVLELFLGAADGFKAFKQLGDARLRWIQRDMIMLENQIPLFILDRLLGLQIGRPNQKGLAAKLALRFFDPLMPTHEPLKKSNGNKLESSLGSETAGLHCLDVFRLGLLRSGPQPVSHAVGVADKRRQQLIQCVTKLRNAGVEFEKRNTDRFWDIKFDNGILRIPRLSIDDGTKSLFLNLMAFEQFHHDCSNDITSYVIFMDNLINSPEDVGHLHYCGIIEHWLGSNAEVADLFNRLCREVVFDFNHSYLSQPSEQVNRYYNQNTRRASLKHNYFNNPWAITSFIAAVVSLLLTSAQTFYSVYGYYRPPS